MAIPCLEELQNFSTVVSNAELLELTTKARECAERAVLNHRKQTNITNHLKL